MANVDVNASDKDRALTMLGIVSDVVEDIESQSPESKKVNIKKFLLHVAWHEGRFLQTRIQDPRQPGGSPGPGRSFFQFEPTRAKEAVNYAQQKEPDRFWLTLLSTRSNNTTQALLDASNEIINGTAWPATNLIERLLSGDDLFGAYLARIALAKITQPIPEGNSNHATYWADHWKRVFDPSGPGSRPFLINQFTTKADDVDKLLA